MASIEISPENNMPTIVGLAGGSLEMENYWYSDGRLYVQDVTQETLDAALVTHNSDLETHLLQPLRVVITENISQLANKYIEQYYPSFRRELFIALGEEARNDGLTNRAAYIKQLLTWVKTVVASCIQAEIDLDVETDPLLITNYSIDFTIFDASNPNITIKAALEILD
jgi:hypothetical protein